METSQSALQDFFPDSNVDEMGCCRVLHDCDDDGRHKH